MIEEAAGLAPTPTLKTQSRIKSSHWASSLSLLQYFAELLMNSESLASHIELGSDVFACNQQLKKLDRKYIVWLLTRTLN